jgi:hypothetical protein
MTKRVPVEPAEVRAVVLRGLAAGSDPDELHLELIAFQREHDFTMAEVLLELASDALMLSNASRVHPIDYQDLLKTHLQEYEYRGKVDHRSIRYALTYPAARAGGLQPDFLDDISWWHVQLWPYALQSLLAYLRAAADLTHRSFTDLAHQLAEQHHVDL